MRLLVVGLDGATFDIIKPLIAQNRLPYLARLLEEGAWGTLRSTMPPISPTAWTTFATGKNPGQHGVFDFQHLAADYNWRPRPVRRHKHKTIWRILSEAERRVVVVDVPFTYPPEVVNGLMISGYPTPRTPGTIFTYPPDLTQQLEKFDLQLELGWPEARIDVHADFFKAWESVMQRRERLLVHLLHQERWDLFTVVFGITDTLSHTLWHYLDQAHPASQDDRAEAFRQALFYGYEQCDRVLGHLWEAIPEDTHLLVLSDHGFGTIRPRQWLMRFLTERGWLHFKQPQKAGGAIQFLRTTALKAYTELGWLRRRVRELRPDSKERLKQSLAQGGLLAETAAVDPTTSVALPSDMGTHIYLNRQDRFQNSLLNSQQARHLANDIRQALLVARDPIDGLPVIRAVYTCQEIYTGGATDDAPDLIIEYQNRYTPGRIPKKSNPNLEGGHVPEGILLAWGAGIETQQIPDTEILHLMPTMLHLLGQPVPPDIDGQVLTTLFRPDWLEQNPVRWGEQPAVLIKEEMGDYTPSEQAEVEEQLRALGYID